MWAPLQACFLLCDVGGDWRCRGQDRTARGECSENSVRRHNPDALWFPQSPGFGGIVEDHPRLGAEDPATGPWGGVEASPGVWRLHFTVPSQTGAESGCSARRRGLCPASEALTPGAGACWTQRPGGWDSSRMVYAGSVCPPGLPSTHCWSCGPSLRPQFTQVGPVPLETRTTSLQGPPTTLVLPADLGPPPSHHGYAAGRQPKPPAQC